MTWIGHRRFPASTPYTSVYCSKL